MAGTKKGNKGKGNHPNQKKRHFGQPEGNKTFGNRDYHPMNMRAALRHLASQEIDPRKIKESLDELIGHHKLSIAETAALRRINKALNGDNHSLDRMEDSLCGELEKNFNIKTKDQTLDKDKIAEYKKKFTKTSEIWAFLDAAIAEKPPGDA